MAYKNQFTKDPDILARMQHSEQLAKISEQEDKERRKRARKLTFSPGEKVWLGVALLAWLSIWVFLV